MSAGYPRSLTDRPLDPAEHGTRSPPPATPALTIAVAREAVHEFRAKRNAQALWLLAIDLGLFGAGQWLAVASGNLALQMLGAALTWLAIVRLFVIGHDACHQALTSRPMVNHVVARLAFLVSLTPYSLWRVGHNLVHHGFNSLRGRDFVWEPRQVHEYLAMSSPRRRLERLYRGAAESVAVALRCAFVVPCVLWNWTMGLIVYLHHTHPDVPWHDDRKAWQRHGAQLSSTNYLIMPGPVGPLLHHIMEHPAHHLDSTIPLYHLRAAQRRFKDIGASFKTSRFTLAHYLRCGRTCKLYDYASGRWLPFPG